MANVAELSIPNSNSNIQVQTGLFINNEFVPSVDNIDPIRSYSFTIYHIPFYSTHTRTQSLQPINGGSIMHRHCW